MWQTLQVPPPRRVTTNRQTPRTRHHTHEEHEEKFPLRKGTDYHSRTMEALLQCETQELDAAASKRTSIIKSQM